MAVLQVEVVVGAIQVGGHNSDVIGAVLQVVALAHLEAGDLGDGVFLVGVLQFAGQQAVLLHGLGRILGIDAGAAQEEQFLHPVGVGLADDVALNLHVHHHEVGAVQAVGHDAADEGRRQHHRIGALLVEEFLDRILVGQVKIAVGAAHQVVVSSGLQVVPDGRSYQASVARYVYFAILVHIIYRSVMLDIYFFHLLQILRRDK